MAKMIDPNKRLTQLELDIVYMRFFEGMQSSEIAEQLDIKIEMVKDKLKKPNVARYIHREVLPHTRKRPKVTLKKLDVSHTLRTKLYCVAGIMLFLFLAAVCIKSFF